MKTLTCIRCGTPCTQTSTTDDPRCEHCQSHLAVLDDAYTDLVDVLTDATKPWLHRQATKLTRAELAELMELALDTMQAHTSEAHRDFVDAVLDATPPQAPVH